METFFLPKLTHIIFLGSIAITGIVILILISEHKGIMIFLDTLSGSDSNQQFIVSSIHCLLHSIAYGLKQQSKALSTAQRFKHFSFSHS